ncbi:VWA domain-containing protein [Microbispora amethystogenes]|uniref:vWA domain-containing protein n=1 Tax=Microbispora amethystogenes TaxID=1427754 RepID=UPI0033E27647
MHIDAHLGFSVVPLETEDEIDVLVELTAPPPDDRGNRPPATLEVVLDRSGSMSGSPLEGAQRALLGLVDRLDPADNFGLVSFDDTARVEIPAGPLTDKAAARRAIAALRPGGSTDLSSGLLRGVQEARRVVGESGATLLLISDGHANLGIVDHVALAGIASDALHHRVSTTTLGYGLGYDEKLMAWPPSRTAARAARCTPRTPTRPAGSSPPRSSTCWPRSCRPPHSPSPRVRR